MNIKLLNYVYLSVMFSITLIGCNFEKENSAAIAETETSANKPDVIVEDLPLAPSAETASGEAAEATATEASVVNAAAKGDKKTAIAAEPKEVAPKRRPLTINVSNLESPDAPVVMGVYGTSNKFPDAKDQMKEYKFKPKNGRLSAKITDMSYGDFALAIYQDVNSDGKIDKNMIGIPSEPFGFSNNYNPTIKAPSFKDCKFTYNETTNTVDISLINK